MKKLFITITMIFAATSAQAANLQDIEQKLQDEIMLQLSSDVEKIDVDIQNGTDELVKADNGDIAINGVDIDEVKKRFTAYISLAELMPVEVTGQYKELVSIPVLKQKMMKNQIIGENDIAYIEVDVRKLARGYITDESELIGKSVALTAFANRPITAKYVKQPNLVSERKPVTLVFNSGVISMQDLGVAIEDGAKDDFVRVRNQSSNVIVSGKVIGENLVEVTPKNNVMASIK